MAVELRRMDMNGSSWHDVSTGEQFATTAEAIARINQLADAANNNGGETYITDDTALAIHYGLSSVLFYIDTI
jgi:hypothetical protein